MKNDHLQNKKDNTDESKNTSIQRRTLLKSFAGLPVIGLLGFEVFEKLSFDKQKKINLIKDIGLDNMQGPREVKSSSKDKKDLIRIGFIGFGSRARQLSNALGFMHPEVTEKRKKAESLESWMEQEYLNVAIVGVCDVYDVHAEYGLATAQNMVRPGGDSADNLPIKRYRTSRKCSMTKISMPLLLQLLTIITLQWLLLPQKQGNMCIAKRALRITKWN